MSDVVALAFSARYLENLQAVSSEATVARIRSAVMNLRKLPDMGSPNPRPSLVRKHGVGIRLLVVQKYIVVYRHVGNRVQVLDLEYGSHVK